jgi:hypothetical protein
VIAPSDIVKTGLVVICLLLRGDFTSVTLNGIPRVHRDGLVVHGPNIISGSGAYLYPRTAESPQETTFTIEQR